MQSKTIPFLGMILIWAVVNGSAASHAEEAFPPPRPLGSDLPTFQISTPSEGTPGEPTGMITLHQALALALMRNPELAAFSWEVRAREAALLQSGLFPNPALRADVQDIDIGRAGDGVYQRETTLQLSQLIELGGKRSKRKEVASLNGRLAGWDYETKRIEVFTQLSLAFIDLLGAQQQQTLADETVRLAEEVARIATERVRAGKVSPLEETRANVALSTVRIEQERAMREFQAARRRLAAAWGSAAPQFEGGEGRLDSTVPVPSLSQLSQRLSQNPEIARWETVLTWRQAAIDLETSKRIPDLDIAAGVRRVESQRTPLFVVGLTLPLPIFNRNQGGIQEAQDRLRKAREEQRAVETKIATLLSETHRSLSIAQIEVEALRNNVLPGAARAFETASEGYRLGKFGLLDVLDAQRTLFAARAQYLRALTAYHKSVAEMERLIGEKIEIAPERIK